MQKISLTKRIRQIQRIRILTVLACLVLLFFVGEIIISKNPKDSKAVAPMPPAGSHCSSTPDVEGIYSCVIDGRNNSGALISSSAFHLTLGPALDGTNLTIDGRGDSKAFWLDVSFSGSNHFNNLSIIDAYAFTLDTSVGISWTVNNTFLITGDSQIDAMGTAAHTTGFPITITAKKIINDAPTGIIAYGYIAAPNSDGGTIRLTADSYSFGNNLEASYCPNTLGPCVHNTETGAAGVTNLSNVAFSNIYAHGKGTGNGGTVILNFKTIRNLCFVKNTAGNTVAVNIPANCENADVIIDGTDPTPGVTPADDNFVVNADTVQVWQTETHLECPLTDGGTAYSSYNGINCIYGSWPFSHSGPHATIVNNTVGNVCNENAVNSGYLVVDTINCDSKRHFASLMIINGAKLTHQAVTAADMTQDTVANGGTVDKSLADNTKGTARWKKVDLVIDEDAYLDSGGAIDVSEKGYPSATTSAEASGYGPGGGLSRSVNRGGASYYTSGGGGGNGGNGGSSYDSMGTGDPVNDYHPYELAYPIPYVVDLSNRANFDFGSGGGFGRTDQGGGNDCHTFAPGGIGGGRVYLRVESIYVGSDSSGIYANGGEGIRTAGGPCGVIGGAGAGGTIWAEASIIKYTSSSSMQQLAYSGGAGADGTPPYLKGQDGKFNMVGVFDNNSFFNISVKGGDIYGTTPGSGGGGKIVIKKLDYYPDATVKKVLTAVERPLGTSNTRFNPYSLQKGDKIGVGITVEGVPNGDEYTLTDDWLTTGASSSCVPSSTSANTPDNCSASGGFCTLSPSKWLTTLKTINYQCVVQ